MPLSKDRYTRLVEDLVNQLLTYLDINIRQACFKEEIRQETIDGTECNVYGQPYMVPTENLQKLKEAFAGISEEVLLYTSFIKILSFMVPEANIETGRAFLKEVGLFDNSNQNSVAHNHLDCFLVNIQMMTQGKLKQGASGWSQLMTELTPHNVRKLGQLFQVCCEALVDYLEHNAKALEPNRELNMQSAKLLAAVDRFMCSEEFKNAIDLAFQTPLPARESFCRNWAKWLCSGSQRHHDGQQR